MASNSTQVESEVNNNKGEETIKDLPITGEKAAAAAVTDEDEEAVVVHEEEEKLNEDEVESEIKVENEESPIDIDEEDTELPDHDPAFDEEVEVGVGEFDQLED